MDSAELRQMSITNAKLAMNQNNPFNNDPVKFLSHTQQHCIGTMISFFKRNHQEKFPIRNDENGYSVDISGWNIYEWLDVVLTNGSYIESQKDILNNIRKCWLDTRVKG
jgi:hypothetical protein